MVFLWRVGPFPVKALILLGGGLFLIYKSTHEIHERIEGKNDEGPAARVSSRPRGFSSVIVQIMLLDIVFSIDSVITAVGMASRLLIMVLANVVALAVMLVSVQGVSEFVDRHPTIKVLALSFLLMIGLVLVAEGVGFHIPKGYVYFAMAFSLFVETINIRASQQK